MNPVAKALWYIESHFGDSLALDDIATASGVSRFYMSRAFAASTGISVMRYVRGRRLSEAAKVLSDGARDILSVALDAGYGSHEAFTRAFRDQFGRTPESLREQGSLEQLKLIEAHRIDPAHRFDLAEPRIERGRVLLIAGLNQRYSYDSRGAGIPAQWQRFVPHLGSVHGQVGATTYGVCCNDDQSGIDYLCGVEVADFSSLPEGFARIRLAEQQYAVFVHRDHISSIRSTIQAIWSEWLPQSGYRVADAPDFERYGEAFDPQRGTGEVELWLPVTPEVTGDDVTNVTA
jgi:AraC family transcriptional regulator